MALFMTIVIGSGFGSLVFVTATDGLLHRNSAITIGCLISGLTFFAALNTLLSYLETGSPNFWKYYFPEGLPLFQKFRDVRLLDKLDKLSAIDRWGRDVITLLCKLSDERIISLYELSKNRPSNTTRYALNLEMLTRDCFADRTVQNNQQGAH